MSDVYTTSVHIDAQPAEVFPYLTDAGPIVKWMGDWAELDPMPGGKLVLDINGVPIRGEYLVVEPPHQLVFTWGTAGSDVLRPGSTTVEINLHPDGGGTRLELAHRDLPPEEVGKHGTGWGHSSSASSSPPPTAIPAPTRGRHGDRIWPSLPAGESPVQFRSSQLWSVWVVHVGTLVPRQSLSLVQMPAVTTSEATSQVVPAKRWTAVRPSVVPGQCRLMASGPACRTTARSTSMTMTASSA
jgi:uncharacterized protein YndB with AHSA1/START domain